MLKKKNLPLLQECALELNSFVNKYTDERIKIMTRNQLITVCYELLLNENDSLKLKEYTIKDIKDHAYLLEKQEINFKWIEEIPDENYSLPSTIYKKITHCECFKVIDGLIKTKIFIDEKNYQWLEIILETLNPDKLDGFYVEFMKMVGKESIFSKVKKVKEKLL